MTNTQGMNQNSKENPVKFEVGQKFKRSGYRNYTVIKRTAQFVTIQNELGEVSRHKVKIVLEGDVFTEEISRSSDYWSISATDDKYPDTKEVEENKIEDDSIDVLETVDKSDKSVSESVDYIVMNWHEGIQVIKEGTRFYSWADLHTALKEIADANPLENNVNYYTKVKVTLHKKNGETRVYRFDLSLSDFDTNPYESEDVVFEDIPEYEETIKTNQQELIEIKSNKSVDISDKVCDSCTQETKKQTSEGTTMTSTQETNKTISEAGTSEYNLIKFEVGKVYIYDLHFNAGYTVVKRTSKFVTFQDEHGKESRYKVFASKNAGVWAEAVSKSYYWGLRATDYKKVDDTEYQSDVKEVEDTKIEADKVDVLETVDNSENSVSESVDYIEMNWHEGIQVIPENTRFYSWRSLHTALKEIADFNPLKINGAYTKVKVTIHKKDGENVTHRFDLSLLETNPYESEDVVFEDIPEYKESLKVNHSNVLQFPKVKDAVEDTEDTGRNQLQESHQNCVAVFREFNINPDEGAEIIAKSEVTSSEVYSIAETTTQNLQNNALEMALYGEWVNKMITSGLTSQIVSYDIWMSIRAL